MASGRYSLTFLSAIQSRTNETARARMVKMIYRGFKKPRAIESALPDFSLRTFSIIKNLLYFLILTKVDGRALLIPYIHLCGVQTPDRLPYLY
jgi:hypothetical protein